MSQAHRMETDYLKRCFGNCLAQGLAEVAKVRPSDPIEYLAHWLYHYREITKAKEKVGVYVHWVGLGRAFQLCQSNLKSKAGFWSCPGEFLDLFSFEGSLGPDMLEGQGAWERLKKESNSQE